MEHSVDFSRALSRMIYLLRRDRAPLGPRKEALRALVACSRDGAIGYEIDGWHIIANSVPLPNALSGIEDLVAQATTHCLAGFSIRQFATAHDLLSFCQLLAADAPAAGAEREDETFEARFRSLNLWNVQILMALPEEAGAPSAARAHPALRLAAHHLARFKAGIDEMQARAALDQLAAIVSETAADGDAETVAEIVHGIVLLEDEAEDPAVQGAFTATLARLFTPLVTRLVAQQLPMGRKRDAVMRVVSRAGDAGAHALIAHLMAAPTIDERRAYFDALVAIRGGIPTLIDALGHPQWFVVRNAASLLGAMHAVEADEALARLLEHRDERVRKAAAQALSLLDTPAALSALQTVIRDPLPDIRRYAANAFSHTTEQRSRHASGLTAALDAERDSEVQIEIISALGRLATPDAVQKLLRAISSYGAPGRSSGYRVAALEALAQARGLAALPALRPLLQDSDLQVREAARRLIASVALQ